MYGSGLIFALLVFGATYFHRQVGMIILFFVGLSCAQSEYETPETVQKIIEGLTDRIMHEDHWNYSCRITLSMLSIILFFAAIKKTKIEVFQKETN